MSARVATGLPLPQGFGEDPLTHFSRVFCRFLQVVFATFEKGAYQWNADDKLSDIIISDQSTIASEVVERRPAIILSRGPAALSNIAIDQFAGPLLDTKGNFTPNLDPVSGARRHTDLISCNMTYNCLSSEGIEAQRIAWTAAYATRTLKRSLMRAGFHRVGEDIQVGGESAPGSVVQPDAKEIIMVSVSVPFYFQDSWSVAPVDKSLLNHVNMALSSETRYSPPPPTPIKGPSIDGQALVKVYTLNQATSVGPYKSPKTRK